MAKGPFKMNGYSYPGIAPTRNISKSEQAKKEGASEETIQKLKNIEEGEEKLSTLTNPSERKNVLDELSRLQPKRT